MTFVIRLAIIARIHFLDSVIQRITLNAYLPKADLFIMILHTFPKYPGKDDEMGRKGAESHFTTFGKEMNRRSLQNFF